MVNLRVAISGAGRYGELLLRYLNEEADTLGIEIVGFVTRRRERREQLETDLHIPGYSNLGDLMKQTRLDILLVATPDHLHFEDSCAALLNGTHVFVQKPLTTQPGEAKELCAVASRCGCLLGVDFHKRFDPDISRIHQLVKGGELGQPLYITAHMEDRIEVPTEWFSWADSSSPIWFLGTHLFDLIRFVTCREVCRVFAVGGRHPSAQRDGLALDYAQILLECEEGLSAAVTCGWVLPNSFEAIVRQGITLTCTEGTITINSQDRGVRMSRGGTTETLNNHFMYRRKTSKGERFGGYAFAGLACFIDDVRSGRDNATAATGEDGLRATLIAAAVEESAASGAPVEVIYS